MLAAIPPLLVWFVLFLYLNRVERRLISVEDKLKK
jgi:hypothetical protein